VEIGLAVAPADILSLSPLPLLAAATAHRRSPLPIDGGAPPLPLLAPHCRLRLDQIINGIALAFVVFEVLVGILTVLRFVQAQRFWGGAELRAASHLGLPRLTVVCPRGFTRPAVAIEASDALVCRQRFTATVYPAREGADSSDTNGAIDPHAMLNRHPKLSGLWIN
jgi:hypothetical protein